MSNTFCVLPWIHHNINSNGDLRVCCLTHSAPDMGLLRKSDGQIYNIAHHRLSEFQNCQKLRSIRLDGLNNVQNPECQRCFRDESLGIISRRQEENAYWESTFNLAEAKRITNEQTGKIIEKFTPYYYDLRFGNYCNLKCRMCGPSNSMTWYEDWKILKRENIPGLSNEGQYSHSYFNWYKNPSFWNDFYEQMPHIKKLYIIGGDEV